MAVLGEYQITSPRTHYVTLGYASGRHFAHRLSVPDGRVGPESAILL